MRDEIGGGFAHASRERRRQHRHSSRDTAVAKVEITQCHIERARAVAVKHFGRIAKKLRDQIALVIQFRLNATESRDHDETFALANNDAGARTQYFQVNHRKLVV